ncbi:MAG TPA: hypothetical protein VK447_12835 [Myxococcaceae bacterium]|nr:hypothetical protein [Myxococcaceae bacterium]
MRLAITGAGAVTTVGRTAAAACAAIRAGISRPRKVREFRVMDEESHEDVPFTGHPIRGYTDGFQLVGRWLRLALGCVEDLLAEPAVPDSSEHPFWEKTGLVLVTAYPDSEIFLTEEEASALEEIREAYLKPLHKELGLPILDRNVELVPRAHAGTALGLQAGMRMLAGRLDRVLVVAADSWFDSLALEQLASHRRLKDEERAAGMMPGEAGVCLLVETPLAARQRGARASAMIEAVAVGHEPNHFFSEGRNMGQTLAACFEEVLASGAPFEGDIYSDLNGETWRAHELGTARVRLGEKWGNAALHLPCGSVGDVGAASGALGILLAAHDLSRGNSRNGSALVLSSSERGDVGCVSLQPANDVSRRTSET